MTLGPFAYVEGTSGVPGVGEVAWVDAAVSVKDAVDDVVCAMSGEPRDISTAPIPTRHIVMTLRSFHMYRYCSFILPLRNFALPNKSMCLTDVEPVPPPVAGV